MTARDDLYRYATVAFEDGVPPVVDRHLTKMLDAIRAELLREVETALSARRCSPESVSIARRLVDERLCSDCQGYGQTMTETQDGGIVRRCRACNGQGLCRATTTSPGMPKTATATHDHDEWVRCSGLHCPNAERYAKATERGWQHRHMDTWQCPTCAASRPDSTKATSPNG